MSSETRLENPLGKNTARDVREELPEVIPIADIEAAIRSIRHGTVQVIIQDGVVVQIDRTEKLRLRQGKSVKVPETGGKGV